MDVSSVAYAYGAGMLAAFNPCGFVLLPTYVAAFLAHGTHGGVRAAVGASARITAGFLVVFATLGAAVGVIGTSVSTVGSVAQWLSVATGVLLVAAGVVTLAGRKLPGLTLRVGSPRGAFSYGIGYATASLACALPVFVSAVVYSFERAGIASGAASGVAYAAGMSSVVSGVVVLSATARHGAVRRLRAGMRWFSPVAGCVLIVAGAVLVARPWVPLGFLETASARVTDAADAAVWLPAALLGAGALVIGARRGRRSSQHAGGESTTVDGDPEATAAGPTRSS